MHKGKWASAGFTFIELTIFLVVSSVALVGVLLLFQVSSAKSGDLIVYKQAQEAALALLEEVESMPFTFCDLSDPAATIALSSSGCSIVQGLAPAGGKSRGSLVAPFNNAGDYGGYFQNGLTDINGVPVPGLATYSSMVSLSQVSIGGVVAADVIKINISVTGPSGQIIVTGYKFRHSPNATS